MQFIDLFCGIGGFRVALQKQGHECVWACDIDGKVREAYKANYGDTPAGDIRNIDVNHIPPHDILCAGFPCQSFSLAGSRKGVDDPRGRLFYEIIRIAQKHKPLIMLLENVKNILTINNKSVISMIKREIEGVNYDIQYHLCNASYYGIPQKRERVYFVCLRKGEGLNYKRPKETYKKKYLEHVVIAKELCKDLVIDRTDMHIDIEPKENELKPIRIGAVNKGNQGERIYSVKGHSITISATSGGAGAKTGLYFVDGQVRRLHVQECKQLMGFPKRHKVSDGHEGYKQLGNAVMPPMIESVFNAIRV